MNYEFSSIFGEATIYTPHELPTFSFQTWAEARDAGPGKMGLKSIEAIPNPMPLGNELCYRVEFYVGSGIPNMPDLVAALDALAARHAEEHDVVLEPLEM